MIRSLLRRLRAPKLKPVDGRLLRIVLSIDGKCVVHTSHGLALTMIDCHYGKPIEHELLVNSSRVKLTLSEIDPER